MSPETILELVGYFASLLVLVSLLMTSLVKLRILNSIGSFIFAVYALLIHSYPTAVMNFCLVIINGYFLVKILRQKTLLSMVTEPVDSPAVQHFIQFYRNDIQSHFPGYDFQIRQEETAFFVYADANPVGLLIGRADGETLSVSLDYSCPAYRDCSVGQYLYGQLPHQGVKRLVAQGGDTGHDAYLRKMGFAQKDETFIKELV